LARSLSRRDASSLIELPDIRGWAKVVAACLADGGLLYLYEGHPMMWTLDQERKDDLLVVRERYFELPEPMQFDGDTTYVDGPKLEHTRTCEWNHGLGEIVTALLDAGMELTLLEEHQSVPWTAIPGQMRDIGGGEMQLKDRPERLPHSYTLQAKRVR